jgi:hypothetical protein
MVNMDQFGTMSPISIFTEKVGGPDELQLSEKTAVRQKGFLGNLPDLRQPVYCEGQPYIRCTARRCTARTTARIWAARTSIEDLSIFILGRY